MAIVELSKGNNVIACYPVIKPRLFNPNYPVADDEYVQDAIDCAIEEGLVAAAERSLVTGRIRR